MSSSNNPHDQAVGAPFDRVLADAREYRPDTARAELGFGTRLSARIAELRREGDSPGRTIWDEALAWLWGGAAGTAPVVAGLVIWFLIANGLNVNPGLESGFDGFFSHLSSYLPFGSGQ